MNPSTVKSLVLKDLAMLKLPILAYWLAGAVAIALVLLGGDRFSTMASILFITALAVTGIHPIFQTVAMERTENNLPFIMSLPIAMREYVFAKVIANLGIFLTVWLTLSAASLMIFLGDSMPRGMLPFFCISLVAILLAYVIMLTVALATDGIGPTIVVVTLANIGTQLYLWLLIDLYDIRSVMYGAVPVWNTTVIAILLAQFALVIALIWFAVFVRLRRKDIL